MGVRPKQLSRSDIPKDFPGRGILKCGICGEAYILHLMKPCPELGMDVIRAGRPKIHRNLTSSCVQCGKTAAKRKNGDGYTMYCSSTCRKKQSRINGSDT